MVYTYHLIYNGMHCNKIAMCRLRLACMKIVIEIEISTTPSKKEEDSTLSVNNHTGHRTLLYIYGY